MPTSENSSTADPSRAKEAHSVLRREAQWFDWWTLLNCQKKAFLQLIGALRQAVVAVQKSGNEGQRYQSFFESRKDLRNFLFVLDGQRGTGKSSLMASLARATVHTTAKAWDQEYFDGLTSATQEDPEYAELRTILDQLRGHLVWLDPIEMELQDEHTNLLAAILTRIEIVIKRIAHANQSGMRAMIRGSDTSAGRAVTGLNLLTSDVSACWDGNLPQRGAALDPDSYATEVMRVERAKATIQHRFGNVLDALAADFPWPGTVTNPLFVLPIDDFDLNPPRVLNLLRAIRMLHNTPAGSRLFSIICGNRRMAQDYLELQFFNDATKDSKQLSKNKLLFEHFRVEARRSSAFAIRKLLPPAQVASLDDMEWPELMAFRPESKDFSVKEILQKIRFDIAANHEILGSLNLIKRVHHIDAFVNGAPFGNLFPPPPQTSASQNQPAAKPAEPPVDPPWTSYSVQRNLTAPVRNAVDTWQRLRNILDFEGSRRLQKLQDILVDLFKDSVRTDATLTEIIRSDDDQFAIDHIFAHQSDLDPTVLDIRYDTSADSIFGRLQSSFDGPEIVGWQQGDWEVQFVPAAARTNDPNKRRVSGYFSHRTKGIFALTHDLLALDERAVLFHSATPDAGSVNLAAARWLSPSGQITPVHWLAPKLDSFWEWDHFSHVWFGLIKAVREKLGSLFFDYDIATELGYRWILEGTAIVDLRSFPSELYTASRAADAVAGTSEGWPTLWERLSRLFRAVEGSAQGGTVKGSSSNETTPEVRRALGLELKVREWLQNVVLLLCPESGLPPNIAQLFFDSKTIGNSFESFLSRKHIQGFLVSRRQEVARRFVEARDFERVLDLFRPTEFVQESMLRRWIKGNKERWIAAARPVLELLQKNADALDPAGESKSMQRLTHLGPRPRGRGRQSTSGDPIGDFVTAKDIVNWSLTTERDLLLRRGPYIVFKNGLGLQDAVERINFLMSLAREAKLLTVDDERTHPINGFLNGALSPSQDWIRQLIEEAAR